VCFAAAGDIGCWRRKIEMEELWKNEVECDRGGRD
jgi:hypothetical protein